MADTKIYKGIDTTSYKKGYGLQSFKKEQAVPPTIAVKPNKEQVTNVPSTNISPQKTNH